MEKVCTLDDNQAAAKRGSNIEEGSEEKEEEMHTRGRKSHIVPTHEFEITYICNLVPYGCPSWVA